MVNVMKKLRTICLILITLLTLTACGGDKWQESYDLGMRYLSEGNYAEAIIAFDKAIEIDPKQPMAYVGLADVYISQDEFDKAMEILQEALEKTNNADNITDKLAEIEAIMNTDIRGTLDISDYSYSYESGGEITTWPGNEGSVGGMDLSFTVNGPEDTKNVYIATWEKYFTEKEITERAPFYIDIWKEEDTSHYYMNDVPFDVMVGHPVMQEELGQQMQVLLIGTDENGDMTGYAIVTEQIPMQ